MIGPVASNGEAGDNEASIKMIADSAKVRDAFIDVLPKIKELLNLGFYVWTYENLDGLLVTYAQTDGLEFSIVSTLIDGKPTGLTIVGDYKDPERTSVTINHVYDLDGSPSKNISITVSKNRKVVSQMIDATNIGAAITQVKENENLYPEALKLLIALKDAKFDENLSKTKSDDLHGIWVNDKKQADN